jgi:signal transduction histidine kinase
VAGETLRRALGAGARDFVTKPFDSHEVLLRIRNLLETRFLHLALERQKEALEEQVQVRTRQLLQMEKLSAMGQLLAGVAHELNNPLAVVSGQAQLLKMGCERTPQAARADKIVRAADRCVRIVRNFLALAREWPPERAAVGLNGIVREAVELLEYELRTDGVEVELGLDPELPMLWADPHQLHQVLVNLLTNAHHAMRQMDGPRLLRLSTGVEPETGRAVVTVADSGPGIPPAIRDRIFEPFFTTKGPGQGTGLGLSLSHGIIASHGGTIEVESEPGSGAAFRITLPCGSAPSTSSGERSDEALPALRPLCVLVVDDESDVASVLVEMLEAEGHEVHTATNGEEALKLLEQQRFDIVLSDTKMPVLDGQGLYLEATRRDPDLRRRMAFITGDVLSPDKRAFLEGTGAPWVTKPFGIQDVRRIVRRLQDV